MNAHFSKIVLHNKILPIIIDQNKVYQKASFSGTLHWFDLILSISLNDSCIYS